MGLRESLAQDIKDRGYTHLSSSSPGTFQPPETTSSLALEYQALLEQEAALAEQKRNQKNVLLDVVGSSLWAGLDTASFGALGWIATDEW